MSASSEEMGAGSLETAALEEQVSGPGDIRAWQQQLLRIVLRAAVVVGIFVVLAGSYDAFLHQDWWVIAAYWAAFGLVVLVLLWRTAPYALQAWAMVAFVYVVGVVDFVVHGTGGSAWIFMWIMPLVAGIFVGRRASIVALVLAVLTVAGFGVVYNRGLLASPGNASVADPFMLVIPFLVGAFLGRRASIPALVLATLAMAGLGVAFSTGLLTIPGNPPVAEPGRWIAGTLALLFLGILIVVSLDFVVPRFAAALGQNRRLVQKLEERPEHLEEQVAQRTTHLSRRVAQLETAAHVARDAMAIQDLEELLAKTVDLIVEKLGFYHARIFLLDQEGEYAELRAASSEGGQRILDQGYRLKVGNGGIVGQVVAQGEARVALDVGADAVVFDDPDLPDTRSEVALPLHVWGDVIGALDVQSTESNAFDQGDVDILQTLADQVSVAISNARFLRRAQESLDAERRVYGEWSLEAWRDLRHARPSLRQRYDPQGLLSADGHWREEMKLAVLEGRAIPGWAGPAATLSIPLRVREQVIGVIDAHKPVGAGNWTEEEAALLQTLVDQLAVALDSARLYQDTQRRATEDRLVGDITSRIRETLDVDTVLQTALREMARALGVSKAEVRLRSGTGGSRAGHRPVEPGQGSGLTKETDHVGQL